MAARCLIDRAEGRLCRIQRRQGVACIAQIGRHGVDAIGSKTGLQFLQRMVQIGRVTGHQRHLGPFLQKSLGAGQADAFAAAGDQNMLVAQVQVHGALF